MAPRALALRFGGMALALVVLAAAWSFAGPGYRWLLVALGGALAPQTIALEPTRAHEITLRYTQPTLLGDPWVSISTLALAGGPLLLASLILLTPRLSLARRGAGLLAVAAAFLALHLLAVAFEAWGLQWSVEGRAVNLDSTAAVEPLFYVAVPAVAAGLWAWRFWLPALKDVKPSSPSQGRRPESP